MPTIGSKIYYEKLTGNVILKTGEGDGDYLIPTTWEQDFVMYPALAKYDPNLVGCMELAYQQYHEDFMKCISYAIDLSTPDPQMRFTYPTGDETPYEPPVPLTEQVVQLKQQLASQQAYLDEMTLLLADMITGSN